MLNLEQIHYQLSPNTNASIRLRRTEHGLLTDIELKQTAPLDPAELPELAQAITLLHKQVTELATATAKQQ